MTTEANHGVREGCRRCNADGGPGCGMQVLSGAKSCDERVRGLGLKEIGNA